MIFLRLPPAPGSDLVSPSGFVPASGPIPGPGGGPVPASVSSPRPSGQEPGQPAVCSPIARIGEHRRSVHEIEPGPDNRSEAHRSRGRVNPHRPRERVVVRDAEPLKTELRRLSDQLLGVGSAPQEGVVRDRLQLHVAGAAAGAGAGAGNGARAVGGTPAIRTPSQGKIPCTNQRDASPESSSR